MFSVSQPLSGACLSVALLCALLGPTPQAEARVLVPLIVTQDRGGLIGERIGEINQLKTDRRPIELRGTCYSACTMYLELPDVCVDAEAEFGFHGPSSYGRPLEQEVFEHWSVVMANSYREPLRSWFLQTGRYRIEGYYRLSGAQIISLGYKACDV